MAAFGGFQFASPAQYGDWAQYAGFNRVTGEVEGGALTQAVKPPQGTAQAPQNIQQFVQQRLAPAQNRVAAIPPAMQQIGQGNIVQGVGTFRAGQPAAAPTNQAPVDDNEYDYTPRF